MIELFRKYTVGKKVLILGFGREGRSTLKFIRRHFPGLTIGIADRNKDIDTGQIQGAGSINLHRGEHYLEAVRHYDVVIKSPGIRPEVIENDREPRTWLSQTDLFLECYHRQIIGVTGTKGKSTTSSLIFHLLREAGKDALLVGNIGQPAFDLLDRISGQTHIIYELSAHQLMHVRHSPHVAILLNLFPEHLDYFGETTKYYTAKLNISRFQHPDDFLIYDEKNPGIRDVFNIKNTPATLIPIEGNEPGDHFFETSFYKKIIERSHLKGAHNQKNLLAAAIACKITGLNDDELISGAASFAPLEHRLEFVGTFCGIDFYNDSISTIPQSTIEALKTIPDVDTLILGGFDRGLEYSELLNFLACSSVRQIVFTGPAGKRMMHEYETHKSGGQDCRFAGSFDELHLLMQQTRQGMSCVLSPAASSYDAFRDFEERGRAFKKMAENLGASCL